MEYKEFLSKYYDSKLVDDLLNAIVEKPYSGLRLNPNKLPPLRIYENLEKHPLVKNGYIFNKQENPLGKSMYHSCGSYYIQEPSAMIVGELINVKDDDIVLDMCAAPGGKSTHVGSLLKNGLLVTNDYSFSRALDLVENIERFGIQNVLILNEDGGKIADKSKGIFDKVILDAPCSGEGMFRKNENALIDWSIEKVYKQQAIQKELILKAYDALKYKGILIYSTCTFNPLENEEVIQYLLENRKAKLLNIPSYPNIDQGLNMEEAIHVFPHKFKGEGHFICLVECNDTNEGNYKELRGNIDPKSYSIFNSFAKETFNISFDKERLYLSDDNLYYLPKHCLDLSKLNVLKYGLYLGELKDKYFVPSHHLASALNKKDWKISLSFDEDSAELIKYVKGESNFTKIDPKIKGFGIVCVDCNPLGLVKVVNGQIKNYYPKKLRR